MSKAAGPAGYDAYEDQRLLTGGAEVSVILDVGANVGNTVERYYFGYSGARVHAFEPDPTTHETLARRFAEHPRVSTHCVAVADALITQRFYVNKDKSTSSLLPRPATGRRYFNRQGVLDEAIEVQTITLDGFCADNNLDHIDILKLDIQGGEVKALLGARGLLSMKKVDVIYTEVQFISLYEGAPLFYEVCKILEGFGYALYGLYDLVIAENGQLRFADAIFIPPGVRERILDQFEPESY